MRPVKSRARHQTCVFRVSTAAVFTYNWFNHGNIATCPLKTFRQEEELNLLSLSRPDLASIELACDLDIVVVALQTADTPSARIWAAPEDGETIQDQWTVSLAASTDVHTILLLQENHPISRVADNKDRAHAVDVAEGGALGWDPLSRLCGADASEKTTRSSTKTALRGIAILTDWT
ncbi:hypothetical protein PG997_010359 [Apiospora hydei]|uniref:Uncharacterized protein n=1 Tax=Apiospora hydei TaxID=1337664 RepID=A0ABR1VZD5_9PEZI